MSVGSTYTFATLDVPRNVYDYIYDKLLEANYDHAFVPDAGGDILIDMHGIALKLENLQEKEKLEKCRHVENYSD